MPKQFRTEMVTNTVSGKIPEKFHIAFHLKLSCDSHRLYSLCLFLSLIPLLMFPGSKRDPSLKHCAICPDLNLDGISGPTVFNFD